MGLGMSSYKGKYTAISRKSIRDEDISRGEHVGFLR